MKSATVKRFKNCTDQEKAEINAIIKREELKRRKRYYPVISNESNLPYYFKTEYINSFSVPENNLESFCPECGKTERIGKYLYETGYEVRSVYIKCPCGCKYVCEG